MPETSKLQNWRSRRLWHRVGYVVSAAWMIYVVIATDSDAGDPLFQYIFIVPLGLWIGGIAVAWLLKQWLGPVKASGSEDRSTRP